MKRKRRNSSLDNLVILISVVLAFMVIFVAVEVYSNWDAFIAEWNYAFNSHQIAETMPTPSPSPPPTSAPTPTPNEPAHIIISKINIDAPIIWNVPADQVVNNLSHGIVQLDGTAPLGEVGNMFLIGHSSDYIWKHDSFAAVFALLPQLTAGDIITVRQNGQAYVYKVASKKIVKPTDVQVTNATTTPILTLMTCYPVGTANERLIIQAGLISSPTKPTDAKDYAGFTVPPIQFR